MKKIYKSPNTRFLQMSVEESMLVTVSGGQAPDGNPDGFEGIGGSNGDGNDLTRRQGGNSLWDTWSN